MVPGDVRKGNELATGVSLFMDHGGGLMAVEDVDSINAALMELQAQDTSGEALEGRQGAPRQWQAAERTRN